MELDLVTLYSGLESITVHVAYEPGAKPYAGSTQSGFEYWSLLEMNIRALFEGRPIEPEIRVPKTLDEMDEIPTMNRRTWTREQILDLAGELWDTPQTDTTAEIYILSLNGYFSEGQSFYPNYIGVALGGTPVIALFKEVVASSVYPPFAASIMEQSTLVHEFGHCVGLVWYGVPIRTLHYDYEHPCHCINQGCVMGWTSEVSEVYDFARQVIDTGSTIMFCDECINDVVSYAPGGRSTGAAYEGLAPDDVR